MINGNDNIFYEILELNSQINQYADLGDALEKIMTVAVRACGADAGFFFTVSDDKFLNLEYSLNNTLRSSKKGSDNLPAFPTVFLPDIKNNLIFR